MGSLGDLVVDDSQVIAGNGHANGNVRESAVLHRSLHHKPLHAVSAQGNYLFLNNGQKVFDATGGAAVACLGSGNERYEGIACHINNMSDHLTGSPKP